MPGFLGGDLAQPVAEEMLMVEAKMGDAGRPAGAR